MIKKKPHKNASSYEALCDCSEFEILIKRSGSESESLFTNGCFPLVILLFKVNVPAVVKGILER